MIDDIRRWQRSFGTGISLLLFSAQCLAAAFRLWVSVQLGRTPPKVRGMAASAVGQWILATWWLWAGVAIALPTAAIWVGRRSHVVFATRFAAGCVVVLFVVAQIVTVAWWSAYPAPLFTMYGR